MTRWLLASLLFIVLTLVMALPFSLHPGSRLLVDAPDTHLFLWTLAWEAHALVAQPLSIFDGNFYYPYGNTLAWSESLLGSGLIAAPIIWLTGNVVLALNVVALLSHVWCGLGAWLLARTVGVGPYGATVSGIVFAFSPARFFRMSQLHLTTVQWMPFSLAFVYAYLDHGRPRDLRLAILFFTLQALTSGHGAVFLTVAILVLLLYRAALGETLAPVRRLRDLGVTGALLLAPVGWIWWHYRRAQTEVGLVRELFPHDWYPALQSFAASPTHADILLQRVVTGGVLNDRADAYLFPGVLPIVLALAAFLPARALSAPHDAWRRRWRASAVGFCVVLTLASLWIFLRPPFGVWPHLYWLPGFNLLRVPSRFMILTLLPLAVLAGIGFERAFARLRSTQWLAAAIIAAVLLLTEFSAHPFSGVPYTVDIPAIDRWLDTQPKPFVVAEVPVPRITDYGAYERHQTNSILHATAHWQKTVMGYTSIRPAVHKRLYELLSRFPDDASLAALRDIGATVIVMHTNLYGARELAEVERQLAARDADLRLLHSEGAGRAYALRPAE